jgi:PAS domain S-box-containing protein
MKAKLPRPLVGMLPVFIAAALQWTYWPFLEPHAWFFFYPAVFISAWIGGLRAGLAATALSALTSWWLFLPPRYSLALPDLASMVSLSTFIVVGALLSVLHEQLKSARRAAAAARTAADEREAALRFRQLAEGLPQLVWTCKADGSCDFLSSQWERYTGIPAEQQLGSGWLECIHPEDRRRLMADWKRSVDTGRPFRCEFRIRRNDGTYRWFDTRAISLRDSEGRITKWFGSNTDIDEHRRAQELQLRTQKMEALGTLAGGIAHDFNNILLAIRGNTRLALADVPDDSPALESLQEIDKASVRATELVRRILTFSRQEEPTRELIPLQPVIEEALRLLRSTLPAMTELRSQFDGGVPRTVADATQIHQIIMNLATNAAHAIGERPGVITIGLDAVNVNPELARVTPGLHEGRYTRLSVTDDGCGMDKATLQRIFDPFFTTKPQGQGTGLGLSVVDGIMKSHGGIVTVYSQPGKGTAMRLYFPAVEETSDYAATPHAVNLMTGSGHILYVDDDEALVSLASRTLQRLGYQVTGCDDPVAALELFRSAPGDFDVVVSDLSMPMLHGFDLARELLSIRPQLPIVITSGYVRQEDQDAAARIGVSALILKPNTIEELGETLHRLFQKNESQAAQA